MHLGQRQGLVQWQISSLMDKIRQKQQTKKRDKTNKDIILIISQGLKYIFNFVRLKLLTSVLFEKILKLANTLSVSLEI